jgi:hypothetical protein
MQEDQVSRNRFKREIEIFLSKGFTPTDARKLISEVEKSHWKLEPCELFTKKQLDIWNLHNHGKTFTEIAEIYNVTPARISQIYHEVRRKKYFCEHDEIYRLTHSYKNIEKYYGMFYRKCNCKTLEDIKKLLEENTKEDLINNIPGFSEKAYFILNKFLEQESIGRKND